MRGLFRGFPPSEPRRTGLARARLLAMSVIDQALAKCAIDDIVDKMRDATSMEEFEVYNREEEAAHARLERAYKIEERCLYGRADKTKS